MTSNPDVDTLFVRRRLWELNLWLPILSHFDHLSRRLTPGSLTAFILCNSCNEDREHSKSHKDDGEEAPLMEEDPASSGWIGVVMTSIWEKIPCIFHPDPHKVARLFVTISIQWIQTVHQFGMNTAPADT